MRYQQLLLPAVVLAVAACASPDAPLAPEVGVAASALESARVVEQVTGHTNFTFGPGLFQTTSFTARRYADGSVDGQVELNVHGDVKDRLHGTVDCMIVTGNEARIGGRVTESTFGATAWFMDVRDNGEGSNAAPDEWTDLLYSLNPASDPTTICGGRIPPLAPIAGGNIQVH